MMPRSSALLVKDLEPRASGIVSAGRLRKPNGKSVLPRAVVPPTASNQPVQVAIMKPEAAIDNSNAPYSVSTVHIMSRIELDRH
jgi:hypothetical protein